MKNSREKSKTIFVHECDANDTEFFTKSYTFFCIFIITHTQTDDVTVAICPGIGNTSETVYIRTFVHLAQSMGYRVAALNHIGALPSVEVTSSRIFSYGKCFEYFILTIKNCTLNMH